MSATYFANYPFAGNKYMVLLRVLSVRGNMSTIIYSFCAFSEKANLYATGSPCRVYVRVVFDKIKKGSSRLESAKNL